MVDIKENVINVHTFEIRYKPNSIVLDKRGMLAEYLSNSLKLDHWRISENRVDVYNKEDISKSDIRAFISFKNAGYIAYNCSRPGTFINNCSNIVNFLFSSKAINQKSYQINRIGIDTRFGNEFSGEFDEMLDIVTSNYSTPNNKIFTKLDVNLKDIGTNLNFEISKDIVSNTTSGPMKREQGKQFFQNIDEEMIPNHFIYFGIDSFTKPESKMDKHRINSYIKQLGENNWNFNNELTKYLKEI